MEITNENFDEAVEKGWFAKATFVWLYNLPLVKALENHGGYSLYRSKGGGYYAGCRAFNSAEKALAHWNREDDRAKLFTKAILKAEAKARSAK